MKTKITSYTGPILAIALLWAGCGSVSAPPIDLPAPITGRIDVSTPDADGNVAVSGSEGAVTGGALVMVVNESETAGLDLLRYIVRSAFAADLPEICGETGHACEYSEEDGSFTMGIAAAAEQELTIGLIHADSGAWRSPTITVTVPKPAEPEENCAGKGLTGAVADIAIAPVSGVPILLKQGTDTTTNTLVIGASGETTVKINGCYAHSIAAKEVSGADRIVVTSKDDKTVWMGTFEGGAFTDKRSFTMQNEPMHAIFLPVPSPVKAPIVATRTGDSVVLSFVSMIDGTIISTMDLYLGSVPLTGLTKSLSISVIENDEGKYIGALLTQTTSAVNSYLTIFEADNLTHKATWQRADAGDMDTMVSASLYIDASNEFIRVAIVDSAALPRALYENNIIVDLGLLQQPLSPGVKLDDIVNWVDLAEVTKNDCLSGSLRDIEVARQPLGPMAVMSTSDGRLATIQMIGATSGCVVQDWAAGHDIPAIALDNVLNILFGADADAGMAIDGTPLLY
ncbi:MAG: hypothetical protein JXA24_04320 [Proteobacteria bacterium]|nr:hypothetical protein [Pseudomonadota bacterium]